MVAIEQLREELEGRTLPGGSIDITGYEAVLADRAVRAEPADDGTAHPIWFVIASLRCMGISVDELCSLARQSPNDTLLFGSCEVTQERPLRVGAHYTGRSRIGAVGSRNTRDGSRLDSFEVTVDLTSCEEKVGSIVSTYLFKRGAE